METKSYFKERTSSIAPFRAYEEDFKNSNDFTTSEYDGEICLECHKNPGYFNGEVWVEMNEEIYLIIVEYKNKNQVQVYLQCQTSDPFGLLKYKSTCEFIKVAAEKFFLINDLVPSYIANCYDIELKKVWDLASVKEPAWNDVLDLITDANNTAFYLSERIDVNSWHKIMTVEEAEELFKFLGVEIIFPK